MKLPRHGHGDGWTDSESQSHRSRSSNSRCNQPHLAVAGTIPQQHPTPIATQPLHFHKNLRDQKPLHKQKKTHTLTLTTFFQNHKSQKKGTERDGWIYHRGRFGHRVRSIPATDQTGSLHWTGHTAPLHGPEPENGADCTEVATENEREAPIKWAFLPTEKVERENGGVGFSSGGVPFSLYISISHAGGPDTLSLSLTPFQFQHKRAFWLFWSFYMSARGFFYWSLSLLVGFIYIYLYAPATTLILLTKNYYQKYISPLIFASIYFLFLFRLLL